MKNHRLAPLSALLLAACATAPAVPKTALSQAFNLERDLAGATIARGEFSTITGVNRSFTATLTGTQSGDVFTLDEVFTFEDGERDRKTWRLTRLSNGEYSGTREDVVGTARGFQDGNVFRLEYNMRLPSKNGKGRVVRFRDVLYLDESGIGNDATVGWRGLRVGAVKLRIEKQ
jgi:hypothetical protein